ncbi:hypothetical protein CAPTEDRAFT_226576 [Capitella teleta]|uniref:TRPM SLOG domain-containing protein n=1 Tax=Capitella teleta TaxID=283909 RepID=R7T437_CAPTE|nr:hypothetical protein CAPTEDRAFT_226576 [Capitella teleta]|eukprot:ELT87598.1 hypothetical protein CAPTEDRAFT_226576 [Capitella teleta]
MTLQFSSSKSSVMPTSKIGSIRRLTVGELSPDTFPENIKRSRSPTSRNRFQRFNEEEEAAYNYELRKVNVISFLRNNIKRKECIHFVPKPSKQGLVKCHCGELPERHIKGTVGIPDYYQHGMTVLENDLGSVSKGDVWNAEEDIREFPTDAFGKIDFVYEGLGGRKPSKFVRLSNDTPIDLVVTLMKEHWKMDQPRKANLVITVIGGAKNFKLDGKKKEVFNRGMVEAAQTTNAWIITSGCNMGIMKAFGDSVSEAQSYNWDKHGMTHTLRCIGIAPWGYVERRSTLTSNDGHGSWNAQYKVNNIIRHGEPVSLNHNHTHFMLVDDGLRNRYGGVAEFRARLEKRLSSPVNPIDGEGDAGEGIPVVIVLVEGGYDALDDVYRSLTQRIPVVVCEGTGRAADILAYAFTHTVTTRRGERKMHEKHQPILEDKLHAAYGKTWTSRESAEEAAKLTCKYAEIVMKCCENENLITVFDMNKNEEFDLAILSALLKGQGAIDTKQLHDQLKLAITWNRCDIAEEKIFNLDMEWPTGSLDDIMTEALVDDKVNFVRLLLQNGLVMHEYLTVSRLRFLYNAAPKMSHLRMLLMKQCSNLVFCLKDVAELLRKLIGHHHEELYERDVPPDANDEDIFEQPFRELFLWSVLMNRQEMAKFLWERCHESIPSALAATTIFRSLASKVAHYDSDLLEVYNNNKQEFEQLAMKVLDECHNTDPEKASLLIGYKYKTWGDINCLEMAANAHDEEFLSSLCCQNTLDLMWKKGIASRWIGIVLAIFFPFLVLVRVRYMHDTVADPMSAREKFSTFFRAPAVKFASNVMMYVLFIFLYCYMLLFSYRATITTMEWIVLGWMFTLLVEEMFCQSRASSMLVRLIDWWNFSLFNRIDLVILLLAIIGFILRIVPGYFLEAKSVYAINCVLLYVRVLREYSASSFLGPKLVMIARMLQELILYMMILAVFLLAYGVSSLSLMYPVREFYGSFFKDVTYYPYWQIYGELYLEELEGRTDDCLGNSTMQSDGTPCPSFNWLVPVLTALYLLFGNLLLLNILIAIFNNVFNEIQTNSFRIWKFGLYFLVIEYEQKPMLAPPFIIFEHIFLVLRWFFKSTCCKPRAVGHFERHHEDMLDIFERECCKQYINRLKYFEQENLDSKIQFIYHRVDEMAKTMHDDRLLDQQMFEAEQNKLALKAQSRPPLVYRKTRSMMLQHQDSNSSLNAALAECGYNVPTPAPIREEEPEEEEDSQRAFSRWPSLQAVLTHKNRETLAANEEAKKKTVDKESSSEDDNYDELNFNRLRGTISDGTYARIGDVRVEEREEDSAERGTRSAWEANRQRSLVGGAVDLVNHRLDRLEVKLEKMEQQSKDSLYNIEALLRNAIFRGTASARGRLSRQTSRQERFEDLF